MTMLAIHDLPHSRELDRQAQSRVRGGYRSLGELGPFADVKVNVNQNIEQNQVISVNALNNVSGLPGLGPLALNLAPSQVAAPTVAL